MLHIKLSNIQKLDMKPNHGSLMDWPILEEMNYTKASANEKIQKQKNIMKSNSNHIVIIYLHCSERQKILTISNILKTTKKNLRLVWQTIKGIINMKKQSN